MNRSPSPVVRGKAGGQVKSKTEFTEDHKKNKDQYAQPTEEQLELEELQRKANAKPDKKAAAKPAPEPDPKTKKKAENK